MSFPSEINSGEVWLSISYVGEKSFVKVKSLLIEFINTSLLDKQENISDEEDGGEGELDGGW